MASRYFSLVFYFMIFLVLCDTERLGNNNDEASSDVFYETQKYQNAEEPVRVRRSSPDDAPPVPDKNRPTKKPSGLDSKQTSILADGVGNKTGKLNAAVKDGSKVLSGKILGVASDNEGVHLEPVSAPPLFVSTTPQPKLDQTTKYRMQASGPLMNVTLPPETQIKITKFFEDEINNMTLKEHNITCQEEDHHVYYNSTLLAGRGRDYWVDLDRTPGVKISDILSKAHREAVTVKLSFTFPFYGHPITNITIATGGFLYTGDYIHSWLAATQYIAPLMANFDTSLSSESYVKYLDNGTAFTVQWENVALQETPEYGTFTFQCTLHNNGDIYFVYRNVALVVDQIIDHQHPVKVGLSDAYIIDRTIFFVRRKTIYEYHRVDFNRGAIKNWTVIMLSALDTCLDMKDCHSCISQLPHFQCNWCSGRCSNGMDRNRQDWLQRGCDSASIMNADTCPLVPMYEPTSSISYVQDSEDASVGIGGVLVILFILSTMMFLAVWVVYAYRNPHTTAGQLLIRYRPSQWTWRRGEARYTAATIHM